jgi:hypothetical protein
MIFVRDKLTNTIAKQATKKYLNQNNAQSMSAKFEEMITDKNQQTHGGHSEQFPKYDHVRDQAKGENA